MNDRIGEQQAALNEGASQQTLLAVVKPDGGEVLSILVNGKQTFELDFDLDQVTTQIVGEDLVLTFADGAKIVLVGYTAFYGDDLTPLEGGDPSEIALLDKTGVLGRVEGEFTLIEPDAEETLTYETAPGQTYHIAFDPEAATVFVQDGDLVLAFENGGRIVLAGAEDFLQAGGDPLLVIGDTTVSLGNLYGEVQGQPVQSLAKSGVLETTADEPVEGTGATQYSDDTGQVIDTLNPQGVIPGTELSFRLIEPTQRELFEEINLAPNPLPAEALVLESALDLVQDGDDLAPGSVEGSNPSGTGETFSGQLNATDPEGDLLTFTPQTVETADYILELQADGSYTVTLKQPVGHGAPGSATDDEILIDSVTYEVTDSEGNVATSTISIVVGDDVPTAVNDSNSASSGEVLIVDAASGVLSNDEEGADGASVTGFDDAGTQGSLVLNADGSYEYTAVANASYTDVYTYTITDGDGDTSTATLTIVVNNGAPKAPNEYAMVDEAALDLVQDGDDLAAGDTTGSNPGSTDETVSGTLDATDPQGDPLTYTAATIVGTYGTIQINADGTYTYTLTTNSLAHTTQGTGVDGVTDSFTYTVTDDNGNSSTATITVSIKDDVPTAVDDTAATIEGGPAVGGNVITGEDGLPDTGDAGEDTFGADDAEIISIEYCDVTYDRNSAVDGINVLSNDGTTIVLAAHGDATLSFNFDTGEYVYTPPSQGTLSDDLDEVFTYTLEDGDGDLSSADLTISVSDFKGRILDGAMITNTNVQVQGVILTFVSLASPLNAYAKVFDLNEQGQEGNIAQDTGFLINAEESFLVSMEYNGDDNGKAILTDLELEGVVIQDQGNIEMIPDADTQGGDKPFGFTAVINPSDPTTDLPELEQEVTVSTNGGSVGSGANKVPADDTLNDPDAGEINYLWGGGGNDVVNGGAGVDVINGGDGIDELYGNGGNDLLVFDENDSVIDGGDGMDILRLDLDFTDTASVTYDLRGNTAIENMEIILLTEDAASDPNVGIDLVLDAADLVDFASGGDAVYILGTDGDTLSGDFTDWELTEDVSVFGTTALFDVYTKDGVSIYVDTDIEQNVTGAIV